MSRPQKMHKPLKFSFTEIINAVADGKGVKGKRAVELQARKATPEPVKPENKPK